MAKRNLIVMLACLFWVALAQPAEETMTKKSVPKEGPAVLDFEADIIEGERKNPQLFLQLGAETPDLDAVLFQRKDFNDFHDVEKKRKPRYQSRRQSGKK